eukprot:g37852.t1
MKNAVPDSKGHTKSERSLSMSKSPKNHKPKFDINLPRVQIDPTKVTHFPTNAPSSWTGANSPRRERLIALATVLSASLSPDTRNQRETNTVAKNPMPVQKRPKKKQLELEKSRHALSVTLEQRANTWTKFRHAAMLLPSCATLRTAQHRSP